VIGETEVASYGATLGPPEAWLTPSSFLSGRSHLTRAIVGARAGGRLSGSILKPIQHPIKAVPTGRNDHCSVPAHMGEAGKEGEEAETCVNNPR